MLVLCLGLNWTKPPMFFDGKQRWGIGLPSQPPCHTFDTDYDQDTLHDPIKGLRLRHIHEYDATYLCVPR